MTDNPDELADLLAPQPGDPVPTARDRVLRETERWLTWTHRARWGARIALVAAVFLLGGAAGWWARPERDRVIAVEGEPEPVVVSVPVVVPVMAPAPEPSLPSHNLPLSAAAAELLAEQADDPKAAAGLYHQAGDAYLRDQDYPNATRCYQLFLARSGDAGLRLQPNDSWLLVSLKNAAYKEKADVEKNDG